MKPFSAYSNSRCITRGTRRGQATRATSISRAGSGQRRVSLVLYLNRRWRAGDGGELKIVDDLGRDRHIEPAAGRLAVFLTAGREHEVMPTRRDRLSLTGWFRGRE